MGIRPLLFKCHFVLQELVDDPRGVCDRRASLLEHWDSPARSLVARSDELLTQRVQVSLWYILRPPKYPIIIYHNDTWTLWVKQVPDAHLRRLLRGPKGPNKKGLGF